MEAQGKDTAVVRLALEELLRAYWRPVYTFVRRRGHASHDAQDLTQEFFSRLLATDGLKRVDPDRGRFRSFLLSALKHFLANEWDKARTLKRGGDRVIVPLTIEDDGVSEDAVPDSESVGPERAYDRQWALSVLGRVMERLGAEHAEAGKERIFEVLKGTLMAERGDVPYVTLGKQLGMSEGAIKVLVHRLRLRYRAVLREEIASTLEDPARVEEELRDLFAALAG